MKEILYIIAAIQANFSGVVLDRQETYCIAHAVFHEARGEPIMGQAAVAYVIRNRKYSKRYPDNACDVVYQRHQFTNIRKTKPDYNSEAWKQAVEIAGYTQIGLIDDETRGSSMYYNPAKASPSWDFAKLEYVGKIKRHNFYIEK